jgi:integrase/recombinase XerC
MSDTRLYAAGEKACDHCGDPFSEPVETWKGHALLYCGKPDCAIAARSRVNGRYVSNTEIKCHMLGCDKFIPEGSYGRRTKHWVCSVECWHKLRYEIFGGKVPFICAWCGKATTGQITHGKSGNNFCDQDCAGAYRAEEYLKTAGIYRPLYEIYFDAYVKEIYRGKSLQTHRHAVVRHLSFLVEIGITSLEDVTPMTISAYGKWGRDHGSPNLLARCSHIKAFYDWLRGQGLRIAANPVITSMHAKRKPKTLPRPNSDEQLEFIWSLLYRRGNSRLRGEAGIAQESGMRLGEICNIRMSDVDLNGYRIFVRLPNKTMTERYAFIGEKTKELINAWMQDRDPNCGHDFLFHNKEGNPCKNLQMLLEFVNVLCKSLRGKKFHDEGLDSWSIHKMRHTMASRLAHAGADYSTIMGAGGWTTFGAMTGYAAVDPEDSQRGYQEAMDRFHETTKLPPQTITLTLEQYLERAGKTA